MFFGRRLFLNNECKILAPVGSMKTLSAAVFSGADYVYLSGNMVPDILLIILIMMN